MKPGEIIFVTGATGYLGGHFLRLAARRNWRLRCLTRRPPHAGPVGIEWVKGDLLRDGPWRARLRGCGTVVHLATHPLLECEENPARAAAVIVGGVHRLVQAAGASGVRRLVLASSMEIYGIPPRLPVAEGARLNPLSVYGFLKACADLHALRAGAAAGLAVCVLRFSNLYGPATTGSFPATVLRLFAERILQCQPILLHKSLKNSRDFLHVRDAARALVLAVVKRSVTGVIHVGSGGETTLSGAARTLARLARKELRIDFRPDEGRLRRMRTDIGRARRQLGFAPKVSLDRGLREVLGKRPGN